MELSMWTVIFVMSVIRLDLAEAKSNPVVIQDSKTRYSQKLNAVASTPKPEFPYHTFDQQQSIQPDKQYQPQNHLPSSILQMQPQVNLQQQQLQAPAQLNPQSQQQILQLIQKALLTTQQSNQPTAMIIIAQPAYVPPNVVYAGPSGQTQQLLNYFHGNPQARYQLLQGTSQQQQQHPQQQPIQHYVPQISTSNTLGSFQIAQPSQQYQQNYNPLPTPLPLTTHMSPVQPSGNYHQQTPLQLSQISHLAQLTSQHFFQPSQQQYSLPGQQYDLESRQNGPEQNVPVRSLPPIITGFENFTPEQQSKIKEQLSAHFGAPLQPLPTGESQEKDPQEGKFGQYQQKYNSQRQNQDTESRFQEFASKYPTLSTRLNIQEFIPSQQPKNNRNERGSSIMRVPKSSYTNL
nr:RNA polymerase II degradation factor 1-like isoform X1 [Leptinotarsa decemlineata]